jgi:O-antigen/teichoic acid export membrane protein
MERHVGELHGEAFRDPRSSHRLRVRSARQEAVTAHVAPSRAHGLVRSFSRPGMLHSIMRTAGFNVASAIASGLGGIIIARAFGPTIRGEYAAITAWFGFALIVGGMGQPAALCFYVAHDPERAREYVATSRAMMLVTGGLALAAGMVLAPVLAHGNATETTDYRIAFGATLVAFVGASYTFSLQARDLRRWNVVRVSQSVLSFLVTIVLWRMRLLTLESAMVVLAATMLLQLVWAYRCCRLSGLAPGHLQISLVRPLATYGAAQIAALTPAALNSQLDQLVLSQTVAPASLGRYAIAVSLSGLSIPVVQAIGNVAFPRLASQGEITDTTRRMQRLAIWGGAGIATGIIVPVAVASYWLVPLVFGADYRGAVPLLWILAPGSIFLSSSQVVGDLLRGRNHPNVVAWAQGLAAVFTVVLLIVLLPVVGVPGAAIASTVSYGVAFAAMVRALGRLPRHSRGKGFTRPAAPDHLVSEP